LGRLAQAENGARAELLKKQAPALEDALGERDRQVSREAALALWRITRQSDKVLPVLLEDLKPLSYEGPDLIEQLRNHKSFIEALLAAGVAADDPAPNCALLFLSRTQNLAGKIQAQGLANPFLIALVEMAEQDDQPFVKALKHSDERVRAGAAVVLGVIKQPSAARLAMPLADALEDRSAAVRQQAAGALRYLELGELQRALVVSRLDKVLMDFSVPVRRQAAITLGIIGPYSMPMKEDRLGLVDYLQELLKDRDAGVRAAAVEALGQFGPKASATIPSLQRALKDQDLLVRRQAAAALGKIGAASLPALKEALHDKDFDIRQQAAIALGNMGAPAKEALPALRTALNDKDPDVSAAAADALKKVESGEK
jgi:HEAT repeat protein